MSGATLSTPERPSRREIRDIRARHAKVARQRMARAQAVATHEQRCFLDLFPLLLHINHPALPGFNGAETPAGIAGYEPDRNALLLARRHARSLKAERRPQRVPPLQAVYLIGSSGTLGQDAQSDYDVWVCHHPDLDAAAVTRLREKADILEAHAATLGLQMHLFVLTADDVREGRLSNLSDESSGNTQHLLLLEEFYRTGLLLAGRPPLWWLVPPEHLHQYRSYCDHLLGKRLIRGDDWLDFGGLSQISLGEFFSAAHWQLFKGIRSPYKSLLKLLLFETYANDFPAIRWLAEEVQERYHGGKDIDATEVDPYLLMMNRIESHLCEPAQEARLELARRAFYLKSGVRLSQQALVDWKSPLMRELVNRWGWGEGELINLDAHREWKLPRVIETRNKLVSELSHGYRLLTGLARSEGATREIEMRDLSLLGRKLFAALERRPGKIDRINPDISDDLHEAQVWLRPESGRPVWHCYLAAPEEGASPVRSTNGIVELLTWLIANGVIDTATHIDLPPEMAETQHHLRLVRLLLQYLGSGAQLEAPLENFARPAYGTQAVIFANAFVAEPSDPDGHLLVSQRADPLSFGAARRNLIRSIDYVYSNSWGELQVSHHEGPDAVLELLCRHHELFRHSPRGLVPGCHCETRGHGTLIARRISELVAATDEHFRRHGKQARYLLAIGDEFRVLEYERHRYRFHTIGDMADLLDYLGEPNEYFRPTLLDDASLRDSPLPLLLRINAPGQVQLAYRVERRGIRLYVLDASGAVIEQWLPGASEYHFLIQQQRFFDTLGDWHSELQSGAQFLRIEHHDDNWEIRRTEPPKAAAPLEYTELILSTGSKGPWEDGFSLLSGGQEFNSIALGADVYRATAEYLLSLRRRGDRYPFYLTGVLPADPHPDGPLRLVELIRFKAHVEQRLRQAANQTVSNRPLRRES
ncbi:MAG: class I adenylate cyclase [Gammaproteobacteria bacterium]|nr:MAG: class I adenylate cyclase [Gammaproteobacteria bacterium]